MGRGRISSDPQMCRYVGMLVEEYGGFIENGGKHGKFVLPDGRKFAFPRTPGDWRSAKNFYHDVRRRMRGGPSERAVRSA